MDKILTIGIPTYNRSRFIVAQLKRLSTLDAQHRELIEIFVSDNCSPDNTQDAIISFRNQTNLDFTYHRNNTNLGMDGNFKNCFQFAKTKYVWVLGDDDFINIKKLESLVDYLYETRLEDFGLIHLAIHTQEAEDFLIYDDANKLLKDVGIWSTFLSGNIVNTKYIAQFNFEQYAGSFFTQVPLYLKTALNSKNNLMVNIKLFEDDEERGVNGGYNLFQVFVSNLLAIYKEFLSKGLKLDTYESMRDDILNFVLPYVHLLLLKPNKTRWSADNGWAILFKEYGKIKVLSNLFAYESKRILKGIYHKFF